MKRFPRVLLAHPFVSVMIAGALLGGGLRFVPAAGASHATSHSTACTAK